MTTFMIKGSFVDLTFKVKVEVIGEMLTFAPFSSILHNLYHHRSFFEIFGIANLYVFDGCVTISVRKVAITTTRKLPK